MLNQSKPANQHRSESIEEDLETGEYEYVEVEEEEPIVSAATRPPEPPVGILRFLPKSRRTRVTLALVIIAIMVVLAFFAPPEGDSNNVTGDAPEVPTVVVTNQVETIAVNRSVDVRGVHITVENVMVAQKFSDDRKRSNGYTVRVQVQTKNNGQNMIGIDYASIVRLILPNGTLVAPKYITVKPVELPGGSQEGYFDFPLPSLVSASSLALRIDNTALVPFGG